jgi:adenylate cyclase
MSEAVDMRRRARLGPAARLARSLGLGDQPGDSGDIRILRRAMAILAVFTIVASNIWVAMGIVLDSPIVVWTSVAYILVVLAALVAHARTRWFFGFIAVFAASGLSITLIGDLTLGGIRAGAGSLIWGFLVPIGALVYFGTRGSLFWFGAFAAMVVAAMLLDPLVTASAFAMPYPMELAFNAFNLLGACAVVFALLAYVNGQRREAQARSEELLLNVLPAAIADRLKGGERVIADQYPAASVLFADLVEFTPMSERAEAPQVVTLLNDLFSAFDGIAETRGMEKIKTIGDAYMAVAGVPRAATRPCRSRGRDGARHAGDRPWFQRPRRPTARAPCRDRLRACGCRCHRSSKVHLRSVGRHGQHRQPDGIVRDARMPADHARDARPARPSLPIRGAYRRRGQGQGDHDHLRDSAGRRCRLTISAAAIVSRGRGSPAELSVVRAGDGPLAAIPRARRRER